MHLFFLKDVQTGLVWATKIVTDPFHDIMLYYKAPLALARGELIDPRHAQHHLDDEDNEAVPVQAGRVARSIGPVPGIIAAAELVDSCPVTSTGMTMSCFVATLGRRRGLRDAANDAPGRATGKQVSRHLLQDEPLDGLGPTACVGPPPAVADAWSGRRRRSGPRPPEIRLRVVQAEDQPAGADPAERQALGAEVILQHPVVARRLRVVDGPDRRHVGDLRPAGLRPADGG